MKKYLSISYCVKAQTIQNILLYISELFRLLNILYAVVFLDALPM